MEYGYFHPDRGYWQTMNEPTRQTYNAYPAGTVEVPLRPSARHDWDGTAWVLGVPRLDPIPKIAPKLALVRALRLLQMDGAAITDPETQTAAWEVVKLALDAAPEALQEDWSLVNRIPRDDPIMLGFAVALPWPGGTDSGEVIDAVYVLADKIDRGLVDPLTGQLTE